MGLAALVACVLDPKNRLDGWMMTELYEQIRVLMSGRTCDLEEIEHTLTDGYAQALSLEAERWRLEKRIAEVAHELQWGDTTKKARELSVLAKRVEGSARDLTRLRAVLTELRQHADAVRVGSLT